MKSDPDGDWIPLNDSKLEWKELKVPPSLEEIALPDLPQVIAKAERGEPRGMAWWVALLWTVCFLLFGQVLPAFAILFGGALLGFGKIDVATGKVELPQIDFMLLMGANQVATLLLGWFVLRRRLGKDWRDKIALRLPSLDHVILACVAMPALLLFNIAIEAITARYIPTIQEILLRLGVQAANLGTVKEAIDQTAGWHWWLAVLIIGFGPAVGEELWFRGFLGRGLMARYGFWGGILFSSFFFGIMHLEPPQAVFAMLIGIVIHLVYAATRSILVAMLIHLLNNGLGVLSISRTGNFPLADSLEATYSRASFLFLLSGGLVLATIGLALFQSRFRVISFADVPPRASLDIPPRGGEEILVREQIPPGTVVLVVMALAAFASVWWNM